MPFLTFRRAVIAIVLVIVSMVFGIWAMNCATSYVPGILDYEKTVCDVVVLPIFVVLGGFGFYTQNIPLVVAIQVVWAYILAAIIDQLFLKTRQKKAVPESTSKSESE